MHGLPRPLLGLKGYLASPLPSRPAIALEGREAAVLVPFLCPPGSDGRLSVLFTVRSPHLKSHSGQVRYVAPS